MSSPESGDSDQDDPRVGTVLADRYRIDALLGEGGMGKVYAAEHVLMRKKLAIKILHGELTTVPEVVKRFEREAMAAANIEHPNVAAATDFGKLPEGAVFLVLEFVKGRNLRDEIAEGPMPVERALHIGRQICAALGSAHALKIVHRDLKPENVMLVKKGGDADFVKVLDFGIARVPIGETDDAGKPITKVGMVFGTPEYMAPEQALGQPVDGRADLYALGVIVFEMIAGVRPFSSKSPVGILGQQLSKPPPLIGERAPGIVVPPQVEHFTHRLLAKEASERFQDADEVLEFLDGLLGPTPGRGGHKFTVANGSQVAAPAPLASIPDLEPSGTEWEAPDAALGTGRPSFAGAPALGSGPHAAPAPSAPFSAPEASGSFSGPQPSSPYGAPPPDNAPIITGHTGGMPSSPDQSGPHSAMRSSMGSLPDSIANIPDELSSSFQEAAVAAKGGLARVYEWIEDRRERLPPGVQKPLANVPPVAFLIASVVLTLGVVIGGVALVAALVSGGPRPVASTQPSASGVPSSSGASVPSAEVKNPGPTKGELTKAREAGEKELTELAAKYPNSGLPYLELGKLHLQDGQHQEAVQALGRGLEVEPELNKNPELATALWTLSQTRAVDETFELLTGAMGTKGADIVFELSTTPGIRATTKRKAEAWLRTKAFAQASTPALAVLVDLRAAKTCRQRHALLLRAKNVGDQRVLDELESYKKTDGCKGKDCYPCLREDDRLDQAIAAIKARKK